LSKAADVAVPSWLRGYRRAWLGPDALAGLIVWSVVTPQAVAYAQIAGLPPEAGLMAAPGALLAYAWLGGSRTLIVSATTATSALSAAAVGPIAHGNAGSFAALSAALALLAAAVLVGAGVLRLGGIADLISKPVMTGFMFGLGLTIAMGQLPGIFGVGSGSGNFFPQLFHLIRHLGSTHLLTLVIGALSVVALVGLKRWAPRIPGTIVVLAAATASSAIFHLPAHGVEVVGHLPSALPHPSVPHVQAHDLVALLPAAFGIMVLSTEAVGVARTLATQDHYSVDANRELIAMGGSNLLSGLSQGFVQSGGASQTAAAEEAGGKSQLTAIIAAGLIVLTGAFLAPVFKDLPEATLSAIVIVAVSGFFRVDELRRFAKLRTSAVTLALVALIGVLAVGVLPGLLIAAALSLMLVVYRLSRPVVGALARNPDTGVWALRERHPEWPEVPATLAVRVEGPLFYANTVHVKERLLELASQAEPRPHEVVLELAESPDLDVETLDALGELVEELSSMQIKLRLVAVRARAADVLGRAGLTHLIDVNFTDIDREIAIVPAEPRENDDTTGSESGG
jgi:SulP family sulfate permease